MSIASVMAEGETLAVPRQARAKLKAVEAPLKPAVPSPAPAPPKPAEVTIPAARLAGWYWQAVARYLENYSESDVPAYLSPAKAAEDAARFRAGANWAAEQALAAQRETRDASARVEAARAALEKAASWQWRRRARLRAEITAQGRRRDASLRALDEHAERMELSLREARRAERVAEVLRRSDRAHLAAANAAGRVLGWRPGAPVPSRVVIYVAGPAGIEPVLATVQHHPVTTAATKRGSLEPQNPVQGAGDLVGECS